MKKSKAFKVSAAIYVSLSNTFAAIIGIIVTIAPWIRINQSNANLETLIGSIGITMLGLFIVTMLINGYFTGKHFDKVWKNKLLNNSLAKGLYFSPIMPADYSLLPRSKRGLIYASHIVMKNKSKK